MRIFPSAQSPHAPADSTTFVGHATVQRLAEDDVAIPVGAYHVAFQDGGRTNWHRHSGPQWLFIVAGSIRVQSEGAPIRDLTEGDAVVFAPDEKHWHGAVPGTTGAHIAFNVDVKTTWMEPVDEDDYRGISR